jgi:hypothetical protein
VGLGRFWANRDGDTPESDPNKRKKVIFITPSEVIGSELAIVVVPGKNTIKWRMQLLLRYFSIIGIE